MGLEELDPALEDLEALVQVQVDLEARDQAQEDLVVLGPAQEALEEVGLVLVRGLVLPLVPVQAAVHLTQTL